jgi:sialate O-acetylesterase
MTKGCEPEAAYRPDVKNFKPELTKTLPVLLSRGNDQPTVLWNEMVEPWTPFAMRGFIWYQGCSNASHHDRYATIMHALYNGWSRRFENPDLKLYFVQLAPWGTAVIPHIQEAQAKFAAEEKNAEMAVINDIGNLHDIHPNEKEMVAKRLALHALKRDYGFDKIEDRSPTLKSWKVEGDKFILSFDNAESFYVYNPDRSMSNGFELAGADGVFKPARIVNAVESKRKGKTYYNGPLSGPQIVVAAEGVKEPKKLRYLHSSPWFGSIYNDVNLPLGAFHIGD